MCLACIGRWERTNVGMKTTLIVIGLVLVCSGNYGDASQLLQLRVSPSVSSAPSDVYVYVTVERNTENRYLRVSADSSDYFRSSEIQLDGDRSARMNIFTFRELPAGSYEVEAQLIGSNGRATSVERRIIIVV